MKVFPSKVLLYTVLTTIIYHLPAGATSSVLRISLTSFEAVTWNATCQSSKDWKSSDFILAMATANVATCIHTHVASYICT